jgi:hypothetical protein
MTVVRGELPGFKATSRRVAAAPPRARHWRRFPPRAGQVPCSGRSPIAGSAARARSAPPLGRPTRRWSQLQAYIPNGHADASHAHYHFCTPSGGCADGYVNQNDYTNQWATFGTVCTSDGTATITLADDGGDAYPAEVGADAIRAVPTGIAC